MKLFSALGIGIMVFALFLFVMGVYKTLPIPPTKFVHYLIIIFTILGINFGISSGKKLAYNVHDRNLLLKDIKADTGAASIFIRNSIIFTSLFVAFWSIFIIVISLSWNVVSDRIFLGETRWLMIISMIILICGSYLFYRDKSSTVSFMLTRTGKKLGNENGLSKKVIKTAEEMEGISRNMMKDGIRRFLK